MVIQCTPNDTSVASKDVVLHGLLLFTGNVITEQAFQFLEGYSDGEGTDFVESGSVTPTQVRGKLELQIVISIIKVQCNMSFHFVFESRILSLFLLFLFIRLTAIVYTCKITKHFFKTFAFNSIS